MRGLRRKYTGICFQHVTPSKRDCVALACFSREGEEIIGNGVLEKQNQFVCLPELMLWFNTKLISSRHSRFLTPIRLKPV